MAVTSVAPGPKASGGWNKLWQRTYKRQYLVECSSRHDTEVTIRTATTTVLIAGVPTVVPWLPRIGSQFAENGTVVDAGAFLQDVAYDRTRVGSNPDGSSWELELDYGPYDGGTFGPDPLAWPMRVAFTGETFEKLFLFDVSNVPVSNSAGSPFENPVTGDDSRAMITVVRNERIKGVTGHPGFDFSLAQSYNNTVNDAVWNTFPLKTVKLGTITTSDAQQDSNTGVWYFEVTYPLSVNRDTWQKVLLDQGYQYLDGSGKAVPVVNDGQQVDDPVLLDGSGHVLASGGTPVYKTFDVYKAKDFSVLNIDLTLALGLL